MSNLPVLRHRVSIRGSGVSIRGSGFLGTHTHTHTYIYILYTHFLCCKHVYFPWQTGRLQCFITKNNTSAKWQFLLCHSKDASSSWTMIDGIPDVTHIAHNLEAPERPPSVGGFLSKLMFFGRRAWFTWIHFLFLMQVLQLIFFLVFMMVLKIHVTLV